VLLAANHDEAISAANANSFDYAVIDLKMPGPSGLVVLQALLNINPNTQIVILTGYGSIANAVEAVRLGAKNYVAKPANVDDILAAFGQATALDESNFITTSSSDLDPPTLAQAEWEHIQRVLNDCDGNVSKAAFLLGISRRSLQRKMRKQAP
jgi:two-component system response regulator RegA